MNKPFVEAIKELLRVIVIAILPVVLDMLVNGSINIELIALTGAIAGLRFIDKLLHETGKENGSDTLTKGLTRF